MAEETNGDVVRISTEGYEEKMVPAFEVNGELYYAVENPSANLMLQVLECRDNGEEAMGVYYMLKGMLGEDGYDKLKRTKGITEDDLGEIVDALENRSFGGQQGKPQGGSKTQTKSKK